MKRITASLMMVGVLFVAGCGDRQPSGKAAIGSIPPGSRVRGVVQGVGADALAVQTYDGKAVSVPLDAKTGFAWVTPSSLATLKDGDFVGTATTGPDDALRAVELVIFPEAMRGTGEGHYGWDVPGAVASAGGAQSGASAMTNGTVEQQSGMTNGTVQQQSAMTNGTVTAGAGAGAGAGKPGETTLTIAYKGGKAQVAVPAGTPIVRFDPADRSIVTKGQKVFAVTTPDAPAARFVAVGRNGVTPPM